ncbi:Transporter [Streptococcus sp. DD10]|uniref:YitT family protein n=1 Tax=Streptococcus sp. DD10 TaxID=1777878 RepID=UPI00079B30EF|nr:YitT family protein [Streptococcus sp. DD10]KXT77422.1 Transporter [Streptococcus sp. DD10]
MKELSIKDSLIIILGAGLFAFGINYLIVPNHLFEGGITGITLITKYLFNLPVSLMNLIFNIPIFIVGWKILGRKSLYSSLLGTLSVSAWLALFERLHFTIDLKGDLIIVSLLAGIVMGAGLGIIFNAGGTTGGSDIIARIFNKYTTISMGKLMLIIDSCVLVLTLIVFKDPRTVAYTLIFVYIVSHAIDLIGEGGYAGKGFLIVTHNSQLLAKRINDDLGRGVTYLKGQGYYSQEHLDIIYCVVGRSEIKAMKELIHAIDPTAFITITDAHEILGEGFTLDENKQPMNR